MRSDDLTVSLRGRALAAALGQLLLAVAVLASMGASGAGHAGAQFTAVGTTHAFAAVPGVTEQTFAARVGNSPYDHIGLHRISPPADLEARPHAVLLYLPGTNMNGQIPLDDVRYSMPLYLAAHGVEVWTFDYRTHWIPPTTPQSRLAELAGWNNELFESDIALAARFVEGQTHRRRLFVAGFSRGVEFAYLYAAMHPRSVQGLVILDGFIPSHPTRPAPKGRYADDLSGGHLTWSARQTLMEAVIKNPDGPAPLKKYKTAADNLAHVVYDAGGIFGGHGGLANPLGGFSDPAVLARVLIQYDRYWPAIQDYENPFTPKLRESLKQSRIPVIAFASTNFGSRWPTMVARSAHSTSSADVKVTKLNRWGHLDVIHGTHAEQEVYMPALAWLRRHQK